MTPRLTYANDGCFPTVPILSKMQQSHHLRKKRLIRFQDNTEPDRITAKDESKVGKSVKEDVYKRTVLEKHREESSSRGEIFCGQKSKVTIEDVSSEDPRRQENDYFQVVAIKKSPFTNNFPSNLNNDFDITKPKIPNIS